MIFTERGPGVETLKSWTAVKLETRHFDSSKKFTRPDYSVNEQYSRIKEIWKFSSVANVISTPVVSNSIVIFGNQNGKMMALSLKDGKEKWSYQTNGAIFSSPAADDRKVVFGSGDNNIYCLNAVTGKLKWKFQCTASVLGCPAIENNIVYIGASDHHFYAIDLLSGKMKWSFDGLEGPVVSTPLLYEGKIIFGAWDRNLYTLDKNNGALLWKWNNGSFIRNYSPAACIPVAKDGVVYVVAPDRYISAIDITDGKTLWRNNDATVRESIGISADGKWVYGKTMQDTIVAYTTSREKQSVTWKINCGFGYEHIPSMLIEKEDEVFFGARNGVVYCIDPLQKKLFGNTKLIIQ